MLPLRSRSLKYTDYSTHYLSHPLDCREQQVVDQASSLVVMVFYQNAKLYYDKLIIRYQRNLRDQYLRQRVGVDATNLSQSEVHSLLPGAYSLTVPNAAMAMGATRAAHRNSEYLCRCSIVVVGPRTTVVFKLDSSPRRTDTD